MSQVFPACTSCFRIKPYAINPSNGWFVWDSRFKILNEANQKNQMTLAKSCEAIQKWWALLWGGGRGITMDSSGTALIRSHHVNRMDEYIPNGTQKLLIQQGIPAATLYPAALLRFRNTYGLSKIHGMLMELPQGNSNTTSFKASGVEPEQMS